MTNIAITGGIGSGKSTIIEALKVRLRHHPHVSFQSMDKMVDQLYLDTEWTNWLTKTFGTCDRLAVSRLAFNDPDVMHKIAMRSMMPLGIELGRILDVFTKAFYANLPNRLVFEFPLLFESGVSEYFDGLVMITADDSVRVQRVLARGHKTEDEVLKVIMTQMPEIEKRKYAECVIDTTHDSVDECVEKLIPYMEKVFCQKLA